MSDTPASPRRAARLAVFTVAAWLGLAGVALATFTSAPAQPSMSISTATLAAPASLTAVRGVCVPLASRSVNLSWTPTTSTFADGYEIFRSTTNGGPYASIATVGLVTAHTDSGVAASTTYYYVVKAKKNLWRSANSPQASVTTPNGLCA